MFFIIFFGRICNIYSFRFYQEYFSYFFQLNNFRYHILHILVTLSADKSNYVRGTITESEAKNLWDVVRKLIDSTYDFQEIAMNKSDDTGSKDKYGDVEIMSTKTSFYNEFKLGVYAYDALLSGVNEMTAGSATEYENRNIYEALGLKKFDIRR